MPLTYPSIKHDDLVSTLNDIVTFGSPSVGMSAKEIMSYEQSEPEELDWMTL